MDARIWTFGATLFSLMYLTLGFYLDYTAVVVALLMAAWVLAIEADKREEGVKYAEIELRPALAFLGIFALTVVVLGPFWPPLAGTNWTMVQYTHPLLVFETHPIWFFFPFLPFVTGMSMWFFQEAHPTGGFVFRTQTPPTPTTKVHVHFHSARKAHHTAPAPLKRAHLSGHRGATRSSEDDDEEEDTDEDEEDDEDDEEESEPEVEDPEEEGEEDDEEIPSVHPRGGRLTVRASGSAEPERRVAAHHRDPSTL